MSAPHRLTGTEDRPIERIPDDVSSRGEWAVFLGGPAIWMTHFMAVYLAAEASCTAITTDEWSFIGGDALVVLTVVATVVAALACGAVAWVAHRRMKGREAWVVDLSTAGFFLALGSIIGVIAVGAPALVLEPVC